MWRTLIRLVPWLLGLVGLILIAFGAIILSPSGLEPGDVDAAFAPLLKIPLAEFETRRAKVMKLVMPDSEQWRRIRRVWGDPELLVAAVAGDRRFVYCIPDLGLDLRVTHNEIRIPLLASEPPYAYSANCSPGGFKFSAHSGDELQLSAVHLINGPLPSGDLVIVAHWVNTKDKLVGLAIQEQLRPTAIGASIVGTALMAIATFIWMWQRKRRKQSS